MFIMGMAVPLAITSNKPVKLKNVLRVLGLFLVGEFLYLYEAHFDFTQRNNFLIQFVFLESCKD